MRVAALEDNVAFLEEWCEEQQDTLDRAAGPIGYDYEIEPAEPHRARTFSAGRRPARRSAEVETASSIPARSSPSSRPTTTAGSG